MTSFQETIKQLERGELKFLLKRLLVITNRKFKWLQDCGGPSPEDLVNEAFTRAYEGKRVWRPDRVDLFGHLWQTVRSLASHEAKKIYACEADIPIDEINELDETVQWEPGSEPAEQDPGRIQERHDYAKKFAETLSDNPELVEILRCKLAGLRQNQIAAQLEVSDATVSRRVDELEGRLIEFGKRN